VERPEGLPDQVLDALVGGMGVVMGDDLVALWLYGSSVTGAFEAGSAMRGQRDGGPAPKPTRDSARIELCEA
jgi:hypothetical protein